MPRYFPSGAILLLAAACAVAQTADRTAAPTAPANTAPPAKTGTYTVQNGELIVAPGLKVPNGNVPWALDTAAEGKQVLVPIHHSDLKASTANMGNIDGAASHTPLHTASPVFFVHGGDRTENTGDAGRGVPTGWALVSAKADGTGRTIARASFSDVSGGTVCTPPILCTQAETLPEGWIRITPRDPLPAGEYALLPVPRTPSAAVQVVYDFTVDQASGTAKDAVSPGQDLDKPAKPKRH